MNKIIKCIVCQNSFKIREKPRSGEKRTGTKANDILGKNRKTCSKKCLNIYCRICAYIYDRLDKAGRLKKKLTQKSTKVKGGGR